MDGESWRSSIPRNQKPINPTILQPTPVNVSKPPDSLEQNSIQSSKLEPSINQATGLKPNYIQSTLLDPNIIQSTRLEPNIVQSNNPEPNIIQPTRMEHIISQTTSLQPSKMEPVSLQPNKIVPGALGSSMLSSGLVHSPLFASQGPVPSPLFPPPVVPSAHTDDQTAQSSQVSRPGYLIKIRKRKKVFFSYIFVCVFLYDANS